MAVPLTLGSPLAGQAFSSYMTNRKNMAVPLISSLVGSVAGQGFSSYMAARANKKAEELLQNRIRGIESAFRVDQNSNFLNSEEAAGALERLRGQMKEITNRNNRNALATGSTAEQKIASQDAQTKAYGKSLSDLSVYGSQKKDQNKFRYQNMLSSLYDKEQGIAAAKANNWNQLGNNISQLGGTFLDGIYSGWFDKDKKHKGLS